MWVPKTILCPAGVWPKVFDLMKDMRPNSVFDEHVAENINNLVQAAVLRVTVAGQDSKRDILVTDIQEKSSKQQPKVGSVSFEIKSFVELRLQTCTMTVGFQDAYLECEEVKGAAGCLIGPKSAVDKHLQSTSTEGVEAWRCLEVSKLLGIWIAMIKKTHSKLLEKASVGYEFEAGDKLSVRFNRCRFREPYLVVSKGVANRLQNVNICIDPHLKKCDQYMLIPAVSKPGLFIPESISLDDLVLWGDVSTKRGAELRKFLHCSNLVFPCESHSLCGYPKIFERAQVNGGPTAREQILQGFSPSLDDIHGARAQKVDNFCLDVRSKHQGEINISLVMHTKEPECHTVGGPTMMELSAFGTDWEHKEFWLESPVVANTVFEAGICFYCILKVDEEAREAGEHQSDTEEETLLQDQHQKSEDDLEAESEDEDHSALDVHQPMHEPMHVQIPSSSPNNNPGYYGHVDGAHFQDTATPPPVDWYNMTGMFPPFWHMGSYGYGINDAMWHGSAAQAGMNHAWNGMYIDGRTTSRTRRGRPPSQSRGRGAFTHGTVMTHSSSWPGPEHEIFSRFFVLSPDDRDVLGSPEQKRTPKMDIVRKGFKDTAENRADLLRNISARAIELAKHPSCSLVVSLLFEIISDEEKGKLVQLIKGPVKELSMHADGTHVIQKAVETALPHQKEELVEALKGQSNEKELMEVIQDKHGIYVMRSCVLQSCKQCKDDIPKMKIDFIEFILTAVESNLTDMVSKKAAFKFSYKLVIWLIECCRFESDLDRVKGILSYAAENAQQLINQEYGNILLAKVLEYGREEHQKRIFEVARQVLKEDMALRRHWWAGHVVDKCAELLASNDLNPTLHVERNLFMDAVAGGEEGKECALQRLLKNYSGRYTAKRIFKLGTDQEKDQMRIKASTVEEAPEPTSVPFKSSLLTFSKDDVN